MLKRFTWSPQAPQRRGESMPLPSRKIRTRWLTALLAVTTLTMAVAPPADATSAQLQSGGTLAYLKQISGNHTIAGQHNKEPNSNPSQYTAQVHDITGKYPGLWGGDFLFAASDVAARQSMVNQAKLEWSHGAVVTLTWHMCPPTQGSSCDWAGGVESHLLDPQWTQLMTNGSDLNNKYKARLDEAVPYLEQLQNAGVQVLFRPLHELNEGWSWWGGRPGLTGSAGLYRITHDYLVGKGLTDIVWDWAVKDADVGSFSSYYPGDNYVDVAGIDMWNANFPSGSEYQALQNAAHGKPIALAEVGKIPTPAELAAQPRWTYFMVWADYLKSANSTADIQNTYYSDRVLTLDEMQRG
jgi:mannan endo-1,4-beta-mannosidase